jgi:hypothetical protein
MQISVDVGYVDVTVDLDDIDTDELIDEIETRGFVVLEVNDPRLHIEEFSKEEFRLLKSLVAAQNPAVGSDLYFIHEKLALV